MERGEVGERSCKGVRRMEERPADPAQMINSFKLLKSPIVYPSTNTPAPFHTFLFSYYIGFFDINFSSISKINSGGEFNERKWEKSFTDKKGGKKSVKKEEP